MVPCRVCGAATRRVGPVSGKYSARDYELRRCDVCGFAFIADPWTDFERIYDDRYYDGRGADPLVDYRFELTEPDRTIRQYEWRGVTRLVEHLLGKSDRRAQSRAENLPRGTARRQPGGEARGSRHRHLWPGEGRTGVHGRRQLLSTGAAIERQHADGRSYRTRLRDAAAAQGAVSDEVA